MMKLEMTLLNATMRQNEKNKINNWHIQLEDTRCHICLLEISDRSCHAYPWYQD